MPLTFRATEPADLPEVSRFLRQIFGVAGPDRELEPPHLQWKYFTPRPDWDGSRSYVLERGGEVAAHIAVCPGTLITKDGPARCADFIDWAADSNEMGAGAAILRRITRMVEYTFCIGGSPDNRKLLPVLGFRPANETHFFALPLRPWRQVLMHQYRNWKLPVRFVRNTYWTSRRKSAPPGWSVQKMLPGSLDTTAWPTLEESAWARRRSPAFYAYFVASPTIPMDFFGLQFERETVGGCLVAWASGQARICDWWVRSPTPARCADALAAIVAKVAESDVAEVVMQVSIPMGELAAKACGFKEVKQDPIMVYSKNPVPPTPLDAPMITDDGAFLGGSDPWYWT